MSLVNDASSLENHLAEAYDALEELGADMPEDRNFENLPGTIESLNQTKTPDFGTIYYSDTSYNLTTQAELDSLCTTSSDSSNFTLGGKSIPRSAVTSFEFGKDATTVGARFLQKCTNLTSITFNNQLTSIGDYFLIDCSSFNADITLPSTPLEIGAGFLLRCTAFAKSLTLPTTLTAIGDRLLEDCNSFTGPLIVNTSLHPTDNSSLATKTSTAPMYTTGIALSGESSSTWKNALPDRTTSPFRKLTLN